MLGSARVIQEHPLWPHGTGLFWIHLRIFTHQGESVHVFTASSPNLSPGGTHPIRIKGFHGARIHTYLVVPPLLALSTLRDLVVNSELISPLDLNEAHATCIRQTGGTTSGKGSRGSAGKAGEGGLLSGILLQQLRVNANRRRKNQVH